MLIVFSVKSKANGKLVVGFLLLLNVELNFKLMQVSFVR